MRITSEIFNGNYYRRIIIYNYKYNTAFFGHWYTHELSAGALQDYKARYSNKSRSDNRLENISKHDKI